MGADFTKAINLSIIFGTLFQAGYFYYLLYHRFNLYFFIYI